VTNVRCVQCVRNVPGVQKLKYLSNLIENWKSIKLDLLIGLIEIIVDQKRKSTHVTWFCKVNSSQYL
jgi:hypothetical protein